MKLDTHETDLYILPENHYESFDIKEFLRSKKIGFCLCYGNVPEQDWNGKQFIDVPFGTYLKLELLKYMEGKLHGKNNVKM